MYIVKHLNNYNESDSVFDSYGPHYIIYKYVLKLNLNAIFFVKFFFLPIE